jgi:hypothetical protein
MGKKPEIIYSDNELGLRPEAVDHLLKERGIDHIITRSKAWFAERAVRTFKSALYKRVENSKKEDVQWTEFIFPILLTIFLCFLIQNYQKMNLNLITP